MANSSDMNHIFDNQVVSNRLGISITNSFQNVVYRNCLANNGYDTYDDGENQWDVSSRGNYYHDWTCEDVNADAICDSGLSIPGATGVDRYPLAACGIQ